MRRAGLPGQGPVRLLGRGWVIAGALAVVGCTISDLAGPGGPRTAFELVRVDSLLVGAERPLQVALDARAELGPFRIEWTSSDTSVVRLSSEGVAVARGAGSATVIATLLGPDLSEPQSRSMDLAVRYAGIRVEPVDSLTGLGMTRTLTTVGLDVAGAAVADLLPAYESLDPSVVTVDQAGVVTARSEGSAAVKATLGGLVDQTQVRVRRVASRIILPQAELVFTSMGRDTVLVAEVRDTRDSVMTDAAVGWTSSDTTVVRIGVSGTARALRDAPATLTAAVDTATAALPTSVMLVAAELSVVDGDGQTVAAGSTPPALPAVRVMDANGSPIPGVPVTFAVTEGDGQLADSVVHTDSDGVARVGGWILGPTAGTQVVTARSGGLSAAITIASIPGPADAATSSVTIADSVLAAGDSTTITLTTRDRYGNLVAVGGRAVAFSMSGGSSTGTIDAVADRDDGSYTSTLRADLAGSPITISATLDGVPVTGGPEVEIRVVAGLPALIEVAAGGGQAGIVGAALPVSPSVRVRDEAGNPVAGVDVVFRVAEGGGTATDSVRTTDAGGIATVGEWTLGTAVGTNRLSVLADTLTLTIEAIAGPAAPSPATSTLAVSSDTVVSGASAVFTLFARDAYSNPVAAGGATVSFAIEGGTSDGVIGPTSDPGDGTYTASFEGSTAGTAVTVSATIDGVDVTSSSPSLIVVPSATAASLSIGAGNGQSATVGTTVATLPSVIARDGSGNPVPNVVVTFSVTSGGGGVTDALVATGVDGVARVGSWTLGTTAGVNVLTAASGAHSLAFSATGTPGAPSATTSQLTVARDSVVAGDTATVLLTALDEFGNALADGGATVSFGVEGGTSTGVLGTATDLGDGTYVVTFLGIKAGTPATLSALLNGDALPAPGPTISVVPGAPTEISVVSGDAQIAAAGTAVAVRPTVLLRDAYGNDVPGVAVDFSVTSGGGSITGGSQTTGSDGRATVQAWTLGTGPGSNALQASTGALSVTFDATGVPGTASAATSTVTTTSGTLAAGTSASFTLQARDAFGNALTSGGSTVVFGLSGGTSDGVIATTVDEGDGTYTVRFDATTAGTASTIGATLDGNAVTSTPPSVTVVAGAPDTIVMVAGDGQTTTVNTAVAVEPRVRVLDAYDNRVAGRSVMFAVSGGGGSVTGASQTTDASGEAGVGSWTLGTGAGSNELQASTGALSVAFDATGTPGTASAAVSTVSASATTVAVGSEVTITLTVRDQFGNQVSTAGQTVAFSQSTGVGVSVGTIGTVTDNGNGTYSAPFTGVAPGSATTISATLDGAPVSSTAQVQVTLTQ